MAESQTSVKRRRRCLPAVVIWLPHLAGLGLHDRHRRAAVVHEQLLAGPVHCRIHTSSRRRQLSEAHGRLVREAGRVYADPSQAIPRVTADPQAPPRFSAGQAAAYGQPPSASPTSPAGWLTAPCPPCARPSMTIARQNGPSPAQGLASTISESLPELREQLHKLSRTIQRVEEQAMNGPEKAIEAIVREVGLQGARLARRSAAVPTYPSRSPGRRENPRPWSWTGPLNMSVITCPEHR